jgi:uncharacterized phage infection (PIP) family protein YhgE
MKNINIKNKELPSNKQTAKEENAKFHCLQTEATDDIQKTQGILTENQGAIKQTLDTMNGSLTRIFGLYQKQEKRLDESDKHFQEIRDFIVKKNTTNGYVQQEINENKHDIDKGHDNRLAIENRITAVERGKADKEDITHILTNTTELKTLFKTHIEHDNTEEFKKDNSWNKRQKTIILVFSFVSILIAAIALITRVV